MNLSAYPIIQASEDARINEVVFLQLEEIKNKEKNFNPNKPFYLERAMGSSSNCKQAIRNSLGRFGMGEEAQNRFMQSLGEDSMRFKVREATDDRMGGFTYNSTKKMHDSIFKADATSESVRNSLITGVPFTFGINMANTIAQQPEVTSFGFLGEYELGAPSGGTLFGAGEIINALQFDGEPTDITNGASVLGRSAYRAQQSYKPYKTMAIALPEIETLYTAQGSPNRFGGDLLIQNYYAEALTILKAKMQTTLMRDFYKGLQDAIDDDGNEAVPTYTLDIAGTEFANITLKELLSTSAGVGNFITKILPAVLAPQNEYLDTNQASLSRIVAHTSLQPAMKRVIPTLELSGNTTGQTYGGLSLETALRDVEVFYGSDITASVNPAETDLRMLLVADPSIEGQKTALNGFCKMIIALAPTIVANIAGIGFSEQTFVTRYTMPEVLKPKRACFLQGTK